MSLLEELVDTFPMERMGNRGQIILGMQPWTFGTLRNRGIPLGLKAIPVHWLLIL